MKIRPKYVARILFLASVGLAAPMLAQAQTSAPKSSALPSPAAATPPTISLGVNAGGRMADPEPANQAGFPHDLYRWVLPDDNLEHPPEKIGLGRALFFDRRLSADDKESCATCHDPGKGIHRSASHLDGYP